jgi:hypothetical protein
VSLAAAREHWRYLLKIFLIFAAVVVVGPFALFALIYGSMLAADRLGVGGGGMVLFVGLIFIGVCFVWLFAVLAIGNRRAAPAVGAVAGAASSRSYGNGNDG